MNQAFCLCEGHNEEALIKSKAQTLNILWPLASNSTPEALKTPSVPSLVWLRTGRVFN